MVDKGPETSDTLSPSPSAGPSVPSSPGKVSHTTSSAVNGGPDEPIQRPTPNSFPLVRFTPSNSSWGKGNTTKSSPVRRPPLGVVSSQKVRKSPSESESRLLTLLRSKSKVGNFHNVKLGKGEMLQLPRSRSAVPEFISTNKSLKVRSESFSEKPTSVTKLKPAPLDANNKKLTFISGVKRLLQNDARLSAKPAASESDESSKLPSDTKEESKSAPSEAPAHHVAAISKQKSESGTGSTKSSDLKPRKDGSSRSSQVINQHSATNPEEQSVSVKRGNGKHSIDALLNTDPSAGPSKMMVESADPSSPFKLPHHVELDQVTPGEDNPGRHSEPDNEIAVSAIAARQTQHIAAVSSTPTGQLKGNNEGKPDSEATFPGSLNKRPHKKSESHFSNKRRKPKMTQATYEGQMANLGAKPNTVNSRDNIIVQIPLVEHEKSLTLTQDDKKLAKLEPKPANKSDANRIIVQDPAIEEDLNSASNRKVKENGNGKLDMQDETSPVITLREKWNNALNQETSDDQSKRQTLIDLFAVLNRENLQMQGSGTAEEPGHHIITSKGNDGAETEGGFVARILAMPEILGHDERDNKRAAKIRDKQHTLAEAVVAADEEPLKPHLGQAAAEDDSLSRLELHYLTEPESISSDDEELKKEDLVSNARHLPETKVPEIKATSVSGLGIRPAARHNNSIVNDTFPRQDPVIERRRINRQLALDVINKLGDAKSYGKDTISQLIEGGVATHLSIAFNSKVSVTNNICSAKNYEHSHAYYHQQLHKRGDLEYLPISGPLSSSFRTQSDLRAQETKAQETKALEIKAQEIKAQEIKAQEAEAKEIKAQEAEAKEAEAQEAKVHETKAQEAKASQPEVKVQTSTSGALVSPSSQTSKRDLAGLSREKWKRSWLKTLQDCVIHLDSPPAFPRIDEHDEHDELTENYQTLKKSFERLGAKITERFDASVDILIEFDSSKKKSVRERSTNEGLRIWSAEKARQFLRNLGVLVTDGGVNSDFTSRRLAREAPTSDKSQTLAKPTQRHVLEPSSTPSFEPQSLTRPNGLSGTSPISSSVSPRTQMLSIFGPPIVKSAPAQVKPLHKESIEVMMPPKLATFDAPAQLNSPSGSPYDEPIDGQGGDVSSATGHSEEDELLESIVADATEALNKKDKQIDAARKLILALSRDVMQRELSITSLVGRLKAAEREIEQQKLTLGDYAVTLTEKELELINLKETLRDGSERCAQRKFTPSKL